jgi:multidrug/hemolysin transport system ATP-binding protein
MAVISVENLRKNYGSLAAVRGIDFYVGEGSLFAFLGTNGAGKSTTIEILCTLLRPDAGHVMIDGLELGKDDGAIRSRIGIVFQDSVLDPLLTVKENLFIRAGFYNMSREKIRQSVRTAAVNTETVDLLDRPYGKLSGGQRRRVDIARALLHSPKILFLDEPTTGLDPKSKESVWKTVFDLQKRTGMAVFLTTHYMEEAAAADYITVINRGEIVAKGRPHDLKIRYTSDRIHIKPKDRRNVLGILDAATLVYTEGNHIISADIGDTVSVIPVLAALAPHMESFEVIHGSMEDVFLNIVREDGAKEDGANV